MINRCEKERNGGAWWLKRDPAVLAFEHK